MNDEKDLEALAREIGERWGEESHMDAATEAGVEAAALAVLRRHRAPVAAPLRPGVEAAIRWAWDAPGCRDTAERLKRRLDAGEFGEAEPVAVPDRLAAAAEALIRYADNQWCPHETTHRGGTIWEICDDCGAEWADDRGGKPADAGKRPAAITEFEDAWRDEKDLEPVAVPDRLAAALTRCEAEIGTVVIDQDGTHDELSDLPRSVRTPLRYLFEVWAKLGGKLPTVSSIEAPLRAEIERLTEENRTLVATLRALDGGCQADQRRIEMSELTRTAALCEAVAVALEAAFGQQGEPR